MTSINQARIAEPKAHFGLDINTDAKAILPKADYQQLLQHLAICESARHPAWAPLARVLHRKIAASTPATDSDFPDMVVGGCRVIYAVNDAPVETGLLAHRARSGQASGVIPVASLLGATLIGMRVGQSASLVGEDGTTSTVTVLGVFQSA